MMEDVLKIKSPNKCAWLFINEVECLGAAIDEEDNKSYLIFENSEEIQAILDEYYKQDNVVYKFIRAYYNVRQLMKNAV